MEHMENYLIDENNQLHTKYYTIFYFNYKYPKLPHKKSTGKGNVASKINLLEKEG